MFTFTFDPCQKYKRGGQIAGKPKGGPSDFDKSRLKNS